MATGPTVSVIVASRERPRELGRCLTALGQIDYRPFEVVVVADEAGCDAIRRHPLGGKVKVERFGDPGLASARNAGIRRSGGDIVAFIDDDAVPEPTWLDHLVGAFEDPSVGAATGYVLGRNGISFQWKARSIGFDATPGEIPMAGSRPASFGLVDGAAVMTEGTNMAFRRRLLDDLGGFDSRFRFYLEDADIAIRAAVSGARTAIAPLAQVHHAFAPSSRRRSDRMPRDLTDIGRSLAVFLAKHAPPGDTVPALAAARDRERRRLIGHLVAGRCEPRDVNRLLASFDSGVMTAAAATPGKDEPFGWTEDFAPLSDAPPGGHVVLAGRPWSRRTLRRRARHAVAGGDRASVFRFSPTALYHRVRYSEDGFWEQSGGLFGRSDRNQALFRFASFRRRLAAEIERVAEVRGIRESAADGSV